MGCFPGFIFKLVCVKQIQEKPILKSPMMTPQMCASYCLSGTTYVEPAVAILKVSSTMSENGCGLNGPMTRCAVVNVGVAGPILVQHEGRWRQRRRADLRVLERQFQIFRHGPVIICTRLPAGGTYYPICMFPRNSERLIGISDAFVAFCLWYPSSSPRIHCTPNKSVPTLRYTRRHGPIYTGPCT